MLGYLSVDIICSLSVHFSEQIMFADKLICKHNFAPRLEAIVYTLPIVSIYHW